MSIYIAPQYQDNSDLKEGATVIAEVMDIKVLSNQKWGNESNVKVTEIIFKTDCNHIIVQKEKHSIAKVSVLNKLYSTITGSNIDTTLGFNTEEIPNRTIKATVSRYKGKIGYEGVKLIDFKN